MKRLLALLFTTTISLPLMADNDRPIEIVQLPVRAREFIETHFTDIQISLATMDREFTETTYEVFFANGSKVEFDGSGRWKEIDCKHTRVPKEAVPEQIRTYIAVNYPECYVTEIDLDKRDYELKLNSGVELTFDLRFRLIGIDD